MSYTKTRTRRKIVTLLGSTRFKKEFLEAARDEGMKGHIVLTVNWFTHADGSCGEEAEKGFQNMHFDKIDMSDEMVVVNPPLWRCKLCRAWKPNDGRSCGHSIENLEKESYIGEQTRKEIEYCEGTKKPVRYLYDMTGQKIEYEEKT